MILAVKLAFSQITLGNIPQPKITDFSIWRENYSSVTDRRESWAHGASLFNIHPNKTRNCVQKCLFIELLTLSLL